jgi:hypothetical protein
MIRALVSILVLTCASSAFAAETCENLALSCSAVYAAFDGPAESAKSESVNFANENSDEPSLANCAATVYLKKGDTTIRFHANKDLNSDIVTISAAASQIENKTVNGENVRSAQYSNTASSYATVGMIQNMGSLALPAYIDIAGSTGKTVYVGCSTSQVK